MSERRVKLQEVIRTAVEAQAANIYTLIPAKVVKWDASKQRANCQILIKNVTDDEEDKRQAVTVPVVTGVPIQTIGGGGHRVTVPICDGNTQVGTTTPPATIGSLMFSHRSLDKWLTGDGGEVDPEFDHFHAPNDCVFVPGLMPFGGAWANWPTDRMSLGCDSDTSVQAHLYPDKGILGDPNTAQAMMLTEDFFTDFKALLTIINTILLAGTAGGPSAQNIVQAAQFALSTMYLKLQMSPNPYLSTKWKNK